MRTCKCCGVDKDESLFPTMTGYLLRTCRECANKKRRERIASSELLRSAKREADKRDYEKHKAKRRAANKKWDSENPDLVKQYVRSYKERNADVIRERNRKYVAENQEKRKQTTKEYREANKEAGAANVRLRQARKAQRTPVWLAKDDHWLMREAYALAALRTKMFGFSWHVDHVIPLHGKNVSGLHVPLNLQVIPGAENVRKGATYKVSQ